jgi:hypothetical protein
MSGGIHDPMPQRTEARNEAVMLGYLIIALK